MIVRIDSAALLILANCMAWFLVIFFSGFLWGKVPVTRFRYGKFPFRTHVFEDHGRFYERRLKIKRWKGIMPEAGGVFKGFQKRHAQLRESRYLEAFVRETCRAEAVHYTIMAALPVFIIWNPPVALVIMMPIVIAGNLPCIIIQRYNRPRLLKLIRMKV